MGRPRRPTRPYKGARRAAATPASVSPAAPRPHHARSHRPQTPNDHHRSGAAAFRHHHPHHHHRPAARRPAGHDTRTEAANDPPRPGGDQAGRSRSARSLSACDSVKVRAHGEAEVGAHACPCRPSGDSWAPATGRTRSSGDRAGPNRGRMPGYVRPQRIRDGQRTRDAR